MSHASTFGLRIIATGTFVALLLATRGTSYSQEPTLASMNQRLDRLIQRVERLESAAQPVGNGAGRQSFGFANGDRDKSGPTPSQRSGSWDSDKAKYDRGVKEPSGLKDIPTERLKSFRDHDNNAQRQGNATAEINSREKKTESRKDPSRRSKDFAPDQEPDQQSTLTSMREQLDRLTKRMDKLEYALLQTRGKHSDAVPKR